MAETKKTTKKVVVGAKPARQHDTDTDAWVKTREVAEEKEKTKRLTIDIPESLHRAIKGQCGERGTKIVDEIRELLIQKYIKS